MTFGLKTYLDLNITGKKLNKQISHMDIFLLYMIDFLKKTGLAHGS